MKKQLLMTAMGLALTATSFGQGSTATTGQTNVSSSSIVNSWHALEESPLSLSIYTEGVNLRNAETNKIDGVRQGAFGFLGYKFNDNDSMTFENRYYSWRQKDVDTVSKYERAVLGYTRKNILTEAQHGVAMKAGVDFRYRPQSASRIGANQYTQARANLGVSKTLGPVGLSAVSYYARPQRMHQFSATGAPTTSSSSENILDQTYNFSDTLSMTFEQDIYMTFTDQKTNELRDIALSLCIDKAITRDFAIGASIAPKDMVESTDRWATTPEWYKLKYATYSLYLSLTVF